ncbi:hypothetical protein MUO_00910 [Listeria monocytogenes 07PF0776]|nr:hypothetical protein MUO_00910 [Listeria monocytogenes 07PF0776]
MKKIEMIQKVIEDATVYDCKHSILVMKFM